MDQCVLKILDNLDAVINNAISLSDLGCEELRITYSTYVDLLDGFIAKGVNVQKTLPTILKLIDEKCIIPEKISNVSRKVRKFLQNSSNDSCTLVEALYKDVSHLHLDFASMNITLRNIIEGETLHVSPDFKFKISHMLNLRRILIIHKLSWTLACKWISDISGCECLNPHSVRSQWNRIYEESANLRRDDRAYQDFVAQTYNPPQNKHCVSDSPNYKMKINELENQLCDLYDTLQNISEAMNEVCRENMSLKEKNDEMLKLKQKQHSYIERINDLKTKLINSNPHNIRRKLNRLDNLIEKLSTDLKNKDIDLNEKEKELQHITNQSQELNDKIDAFNKDKLNLQKLKSYYKNKQFYFESKFQNSLKEKINENDILKNELKFYESENEKLQSKLNDSFNSCVSLFHDGKYDDCIRLVYIDLMKMGVSIENCHKVVEFVLKNLFNINVDRLTQKTLASLISVEAQILAQAQAAEEMLHSENNTLHLDGPKKHFEEYAGFQVSLGDGNTLSIGHHILPAGDADSFLDATKQTLHELAAAVSEKDDETENLVGQFLMSIKNMMTDRHIVNKSYHNKFEDFRNTFGEKYLKNWNELKAEKKEEFVKINSLFCGLHIIVNMASASINGLEHFEKENNVEMNTVSNRSPQASELIRQCAKAFMVTSSDEKSGDAAEFKAYLSSIDEKSYFITFKHNRFTVLFHDAGALFYHQQHITDFLSTGLTTKQSKLLQAIADGCSNPCLLAECRALGIIGKVLCGPLWRILENPAIHYFEMNSYWLQLRTLLHQFAQHPEEIIHSPTFTNSPIEKDVVYDKLFQPNPQIDHLTFKAVSSLCNAILPVIDRQLSDQLPGGKYYLPAQPRLDQTMSAPLTSRVSEADFSDLDRSIQNAPQKGKAGRSGLIMYTKNKTKHFLSKLAKSKCQKYMNIARKKAKSRMAQDSVHVSNIRKIRIAKQLERKQQREKLEKKKKNRKVTLITQLEKSGIWTNQDEVEQNLVAESRDSQKIKMLKIN